MPDAGGLPPPAKPATDAKRSRWLSPLLRRILLLNALPPALLAAALLYLDQYQNGLIAAEVEALRTQARIYAGGIAEAATRTRDDRVTLVPEAARPLLRRLVEPSPNTQARLFDSTGLLVADSRVREGPGGAIVTEPLPPPARPAPSRAPSPGSTTASWPCCRGSSGRRGGGRAPDAASFDWQPEFGGARAAPTGGRSCASRSRAASAPISAAPRWAACWSRWPSPRGAAPHRRHRAADAGGAGGGPAPA
jgi:two-component system sensor histidine kinase ChvG